MPQRAAAAEYRSLQLPDAAESEDKEAVFLETLLPKQLDQEQLRTLVVTTYISGMKDGLFDSQGTGTPDVQSVLRIVMERVEEAHGKGSVAKGDVARLVMPLLQKDGLMKQGGEKSK